MTSRVYEVGASEREKLKKLLTYDPYLDPNLIPKTKEYDEKELAKMSEEQKKQIAEQDAKAKSASEKLRNDPMMNVIFARQTCDLRDGRALGLEDDKSYVLITATDDFLNLAEQKFKREFTTVKRAPSEIEQKFIALKEEEENKANAGFGAIFG